LLTVVSFVWSSLYRWPGSTPIPGSPVSAWAAPVAIRASNGRLQFAALLIEALYAVPQLRDRLMEVTLDPCDAHERLVFNEGQNDHVRR
jgi:hypothetical protein